MDDLEFPNIQPPASKGSLRADVTRVVEDAVRSGRMSPTEAAVVYDFVWHNEVPERFSYAPHQGGPYRQHRF